MLAKRPQRIVNRHQEIETLVSSTLDRSKNLNYALLGFRRVGKTTILLETKRILSEKKLIVVNLDFSLRRYDPLAFFKDLTDELTNAYEQIAGSKRKVLENVREAVAALSKLKRARLNLSLSVDASTGHPTINVSPYLREERIDYSSLFKSTFDYANEIAKRSNRRVVLMIDEFQYLMDWKKYPGLKAISEHLKNVIESRDNVCYIMSGSRAHFLKEVLSSGRSPLFGLFNIMEISDLSVEYAKELYILNDQTATKQDAKEAYELVSGNPFYLIALATTRRKKESLLDTYERGLTSSAGLLNLYVKYILTEDIGTSVQGTLASRMLAALAEESMSVGELAKRLEMKMTSLPKFLKQLIDLDLIVKEGSKYQLLDPVIRDYLRANA